MSSSRYIYMVRHGQSAWNAARRMTGWSDIPLTPLGEDQARATGRSLHHVSTAWDGVWSSDLQRAARTAELAVEALGNLGVHHLPARRPDRRLREMNFGELEGLHWPDIQGVAAEAMRTFDLAYRPNGGESMGELQSRVLAFLNDLPPGHHMAFTHGGAIRSVLHHVGESRFVGNCAILGFHWDERRLVFDSEAT